MTYELPILRRLLTGATLVALSVLLAAADAEAGKKKGNGRAAKPDLQLTLLHNNDGESQLVDAGAGLEDFGGVARFAGLVDRLRREARVIKRAKAKRGKRTGRRDGRTTMVGGSLLVSSGDNFLAGPELSASLDRGAPFYDAVAMELIGYDAATIGNHEFDFGPEVLAEFIDGFRDLTFLSANADFSAEPSLQALVDEGQIAASKMLTVRGRKVGVVGAITPGLPLISSPRDVAVDDDVAGAVQAEIRTLRRRGAGIIIVSSHLQGIEEEIDLVGELRGADIVIAGGGGELLANPFNPLVPGDEGTEYGPYPIFERDAAGRRVPIVTTTGDYRYIGRLVARFDPKGGLKRVVAAQSGPQRVSGVAPDAVAPKPKLVRRVVEPVAAALAELAENVIADLQVPLDGTRANVRSRETNEANLLADALLHAARERAADFGVDEPQVALQNGGGIRNDTVIPVGDLTELHSFDIAPFANFLSVVEDVPAEQLRQLLERGVAALPGAEGHFAHVAGLSFTYDLTGTAQEIDADGNLVTPGTRVRDVVLDDATALVTDGEVVDGAPDVDLATIDFLARGGDGYPFDGAPFTTLGVTYQQALVEYASGELGGVIGATDYPEGGEGRIVGVTP